MEKNGRRVYVKGEGDGDWVPISAFETPVAAVSLGIAVAELDHPAICRWDLEA